MSMANIRICKEIKKLTRETTERESLNTQLKQKNTDRRQGGWEVADGDPVVGHNIRSNFDNGSNVLWNYCELEGSAKKLRN